MSVLVLQVKENEEQRPILEDQRVRNVRVYGDAFHNFVGTEQMQCHPPAQAHNSEQAWTPSDEDETVGWLRRTLPQAFAAGTSSLLFVSIGMFAGHLTLVVSALTDVNEGGSVHFSEDEASWYGSLTVIFTPVGCLIAGWFIQSLGCKKLLILSNVPVVATWLMIYYANSKPVFYISSILCGVVIGFMEGPSVQYTSEISHPSLRSILQSSGVLSYFLGVLLVSLLGSLTDWRHVALISASVPTICLFLALQVPETPMWLMSKGRPEAALRSLQWLRGWTSAELVKEEFEKLEFYGKEKNVKASHSYGREKDTEGVTARLVAVEETENGGVNSDTGLAEMWRDLTRREMLVPLSKCIVINAQQSFGSVIPLQPYLLQIFKTMDLPVQVNWASVWVSLMALIGIIVCMCLIRRMRKKPLYIFSLATNALCFIFLGICTIVSTPTSAHGISITQWTPFILLTLLYFSHGVGRHPITMIYIGEILPHRGRGIAIAVVMSSFCAFMFFTVKLLPTLEQHLGLHGILFLFAAVSAAGVFFTHFYLPETEGRFLSDIEIDITRDARNTSS